jgi:single-strand DNA-binding protein
MRYAGTLVEMGRRQESPPGNTAGVDVPDATTAVNEVRLAGRVSGLPREVGLPSGDALVQLRVVVPRTSESVRAGGPRVDTIDVSCWSSRTRRVALRLAEGDQVEVSGALRRRFFRTSGVPASRYEVEAQTLRRA